MPCCHLVATLFGEAANGSNIRLIFLLLFYGFSIFYYPFFRSDGALILNVQYIYTNILAGWSVDVDVPLYV